MGGGDESVFNGKVVRFDLETFQERAVLDVSQSDAALKGFNGGFTDGKFGYLVPSFNDDGFQSKVARFDLETFSKVNVLDVAANANAEDKKSLAGFDGGFADGKYGYLVPNGGEEDAKSGKVVRFDLETFKEVTILDLVVAGNDDELRGFSGGFA